MSGSIRLLRCNYLAGSHSGPTALNLGGLEAEPPEELKLLFRFMQLSDCVPAPAVFCRPWVGARANPPLRTEPLHAVQTEPPPFRSATHSPLPCIHSMCSASASFRSGESGCPARSYCQDSRCVRVGSKTPSPDPCVACE